MAMVIMDKKDYMDKALCSLGDSSAYRTIPKDPTNKLKNKLIGILKDIKKTGGLKDLTYHKLYPTSAVPQSFLALPTSIKLAPPSGPVSSMGFTTYGVAKELASIICPLVGQLPCHLKNTQCFFQQIQQVKLEQGEVITSYDVKALCSSVPVDPSVNIVQHRLSRNPTLPQRTQMSILQIVTLLEFCLKNTYFFFQVKYYEQAHGAAMGSPISPLIANLFMEEFEGKALSTSLNPPPLAKVCG